MTLKVWTIPEIEATVVSWMPERRCDYLERAGIYEFDGRWPRETATRMAFRDATAGSGAV